MKTKLRIANRKRFVTVMSLMMFLILTITFFTLSMVVADADATPTWTEITVVEGDTLWSVARQASNGDKDLRLIVHTIIQENHLKSSTIYPGEVLLVPSDFSKKL